jgi:hypothetical protein
MGDARGKRRMSSAAQRVSNKKTSDLLGSFPRVLRLRASLSVPLSLKMIPLTPGVTRDHGLIAGGICGSRS